MLADAEGKNRVKWATTTNNWTPARPSWEIFRRFVTLLCHSSSQAAFPPSVWPHLFCGAAHEKRTGEQLKWSLAF